MPETKFVEIRDRMTFIPALAIKLTGRDGYLARRAGFGDVGCVLLIHLSASTCQHDPYGWPTKRTMRNAHLWLDEHWDEFTDGGVVDVEFILGETAAPKVSEQVEARHR